MKLLAFAALLLKRLRSRFVLTLLLVFGILSIAGRLLGFIADLTGREIAYTLGCGGVILSFLILTFSRDNSSAGMLYTYAACFGLFSGLNGPVIISACADLFQGKHFGAILGFINLGYGVGNAIGSWLAGYIFDTVGNYIPAFIIAIIMVALACTSVWVAAPRRVRAVGRRALRVTPL